MLYQAAERRAVGAGVDAGQTDFSKTAAEKFANLTDDVFFLYRAVVAARIGNDTIGAAVAASLLDLNKGALASFKAGYQVTVVVVIGKNVADNAFFGKVAGQVFFDFGLFPVAEYQIDLRHGSKFARRYLSGTAGNDYPGVRVFAAEFADGLPALAFSLAGNGAGVDNDNVVQSGKLFF